MFAKLWREVGPHIHRATRAGCILCCQTLLQHQVFVRAGREDLYYDFINSGGFRTAEALREQVARTARHCVPLGVICICLQQPRSLTLPWMRRAET